MIKQEDDAKRTADYIRKRRAALNLTQEELVEQLKNFGYKLSLSAFRRIELGESQTHFAKAEFIQALALALKVSVAELMEILGMLMQTKPNVDLRQQRIAELVSRLDENGLETLEKLLDTLIGQQYKRQSG